MRKKKESIAKITKKYKGEWVLLADYKLNEYLEPVEGVVVAHSKDRDDIYDQLKRLRRSLCIYYAGEVPPQGIAYLFF